MKNNDFAVFILTHGRPDNVITKRTLDSRGYTGKIYYIVDDEDDTVDQYRKNFGTENVIVFDKTDIAERFDEADNFNDRRAIFYARNACFDIARKLGVTYFMELDDDYNHFGYRVAADNSYVHKGTERLDDLFDALLEFYISSGIDSLCISQSGDFIGGANSNMFKKKVTRKAMNSFICSTKRQFEFVGRVNEDVNTYTGQAAKGKVFLTLAMVSLNQGMTQKNKGGMTEMYLDAGTYVKTFYSVMISPSSVKVSQMGDKERRIHHRVAWNAATPMIISDEHKKKD